MTEELRARIVQLVKDMGQQLIDDAEKIVPDVNCWHDLNINIDIPTLTDDKYDAPLYTVSYEFYPKMETVDRYVFGGDGL